MNTCRDITSVASLYKPPKPVHQHRWTRLRQYYVDMSSLATISRLIECSCQLPQITADGVVDSHTHGSVSTIQPGGPSR
jgi:hypothetical protein